MSKRILLICGILVIAAGLAAGLQSLKPPPESKPLGDIELLVDVQILEAGSYSFDVESQGTVRPLTETTLSAEVSGPIVSVSPKLVAGGVFEAGEELLRIDQTNYVSAVQQAVALEKQRQIEFDGAKSLRTKGYRAEAEFASAEAALATARANVVRTKRDLDRTQIRMPYTGMVRSRSSNLGQFVNPGKELAVVFATDFAEVRLPLTDHDLAFVDLPDAREIVASGASKDGPVVVLSAIQRGQMATWNARIVRTEGVVDERARVTFAVARLEDPYRLQPGSTHETPLPMGTFVGARIKGAKVDAAVRLPRAVLRRRNEVIFVDADNRIRIRPVQVIRTDSDYAYVSDDDLQGKRISLTAIDAPINGIRVRTTDGWEEAADTAPVAGKSNAEQ